MRRFRIVIEGDIPGDVPDDYIRSMADNAEVQVLEPHIAIDGQVTVGGDPEVFTLPGWTDLEFETANVRTSVTIDPSPQFEQIWEWRRQVIAGKTDMGLIDWLDRT